MYFNISSKNQTNGDITYFIEIFSEEFFYKLNFSLSRTEVTATIPMLEHIIRSSNTNCKNDLAINKYISLTQSKIILSGADSTYMLTNPELYYNFIFNLNNEFTKSIKNVEENSNMENSNIENKQDIQKILSRLPKLRQSTPIFKEDELGKETKNDPDTYLSEDYALDSYYQNLTLLTFNNIDHNTNSSISFDTPIFKKTTIPNVEFFYHHDSISVRVMRAIDDIEIFKIRSSTPIFKKISEAFKRKELMQMGCFTYSPITDQLTIIDLEGNEHIYNMTWVDRFISEMNSQHILN